MVFIRDQDTFFENLSQIFVKSVSSDFVSTLGKKEFRKKLSDKLRKSKLFGLLLLRYH